MFLRGVRVLTPFALRLSDVVLFQGCLSDLLICSSYIFFICDIEYLALKAVSEYIIYNISIFLTV